MSDNLKVLILTLRTDENEFEDCVSSIAAQSHANVEHVVFRDLPNKEAHDTLYKRIMSEHNNFDLFVKLDADMVFKDTGALARLVALFRADPNLDHVQTAVHDWYTDELMMGLHAYTKRVVWEIRSEDLFVDYRPQMPGTRRDLWGSPAPLVDHAGNPSAFQAYLFGVHRASKVFQFDRMLINRREAKAQWSTLNSVWQHYHACRDKRLALALLGADDVYCKRLSHKHYNAQDRSFIRARFAELEDIPEDVAFQRLSAQWGGRNGERRWRCKLSLRDKLTGFVNRLNLNTVV